MVTSAQRRELRRALASWLLLQLQRLIPEDDTEAHLALAALAIAMRRYED